MAAWYESVKEDYQTVASSIPKVLVPELDKCRGSKTRSKYIRGLIEADIERFDNALAAVVSDCDSDESAA